MSWLVTKYKIEIWGEIKNFLIHYDSNFVSTQYRELEVAQNIQYQQKKVLR